jgi:DNA-formamidopyrimidine glycosylase
MPELPEVETIRRDLEKEVVGRRVKTVEVKGKRSIRRHKSGPEFRAKLEGKKIGSIRRAGKYLLLGLDDDDILVVHLGMSGQLQRAKGPKDPLDKHTHVVITFTQGGQLRFVDPRTFGEMFVTATGDLESVPELSHLGFAEIRRRDRQHLLRRDPLRRRPALRPGIRHFERPGDPASVPGHGRDPVGGGEVPGVVTGRRAVPRPVRRDRRLPGPTSGL